MTKLRTIAILIIALYAGHGKAADSLHLSDDSTIVVSADDASEEPGQDILYFAGNIEIKTPSWAIMADRVTVYGQLDNLQRVVAEGSPVQFFFRNSDAENSSITEGEGQHLEYEEEAALLRLSGNAKLTSGGRIMQSTEIQYDLEQEKLEASGPEGVQITITPDSDGNL